MLALARYLGQDHFAYPSIVSHVAILAPEAVQRAARYSGLVLRQESPRWNEVEALADALPATVGELVQLFGIFRQAHQERVANVEQLHQQLAGLTPLEMLAYARLYAFDHLIPVLLEGAQTPDGPNVEDAWSAIEDILAWKLATCDPASLRLNDRTIGVSLGMHLSPFLRGGPAQLDRYLVFLSDISAG